jgi:hypothetical protein
MNQIISNFSGYNASVSANRTAGGERQTRGQLLYRRTSFSSDRERLVKEAFSNGCSNEKEQLADDFVKAAKREGLNQLAELPDGQHALAEVYRHAGSECAEFMRRVHRDQGATAVNYTRSEEQDNVRYLSSENHMRLSSIGALLLRDLPDPEPCPDDVSGDKAWSRRSDESLYVNGISYNDIDQGYLGDCSFMASLASVAALNPSFIREMISNNHNGTYTVRLYNASGEAEFITIDAQLYRDQDGNPVYAQNDTRQEIWPAIVEKAYAEMKGGYQNIESLSSTETLRAITGLDNAAAFNMKAVRHILGISNSDIFHMISSSLEQGRPVTAGTHDPGEGVVYDETNHLVENHAYSVIRAYEENGEQWVVLRNPWGRYEYQNDNYDNNGSLPNDGVFRMSINDFIAMYEYLYIFR